MKNKHTIIHLENMYVFHFPIILKGANKISSECAEFRVCLVTIYFDLSRKQVFDNATTSKRVKDAAKINAVTIPFFAPSEIEGRPP